MTVHRKKNSQKKNLRFSGIQGSIFEFNWIELKLECLKKIRVKKMKICRMKHGKNQFAFTNQKPQLTVRLGQFFITIFFQKQFYIG
jgi:hypothetical protein